MLRKFAREAAQACRRVTGRSLRQRVFTVPNACINPFPRWVSEAKTSTEQKQRSMSTVAAERKGAVLCVVMDGVGIGNDSDTNAAAVAHTPTLDSIMPLTRQSVEQWAQDPARAPALDRFCWLHAHGKHVGLASADDMGNSEVGHNALGSGLVINQGGALVQEAIATQEIFAGEGWQYVMGAFDESATIAAPPRGKALHLIGLLSDGGVHSHMDHLKSLVAHAVDSSRTARPSHVFLHVLLDGRDVPDGTSVGFLEDMEAFVQQLDSDIPIQVASGGGRMNVTMDRYDADWSIVERGWSAHVLGQADITAPDAFSALQLAKSSGGPDSDPVADQYLPPFVVTDTTGQPVGPVLDGDAVIFTNFRGDRAIEISRAFEAGPDFEPFDRQRVPQVRYAGMMSYDGDLGIPQNYLVAPPQIPEVAGDLVARAGLRTFACSETQKYGHVTYFWNGNRSGLIDAELEEYVEVPSDTCPFDQAPRMKARQITEATCAALEKGTFDFLRVNYANGDMVGHTGGMDAAVAAMEEVDAQLAVLLAAVEKAGGVWMVTADHGNCDEMVQRAKDGSVVCDGSGRQAPLTSHTLAPVPLAIGGPGLAAEVRLDREADSWFGRRSQETGGQAVLANVTATFLELLGVEKSAAMEDSLLTR